MTNMRERTCVLKNNRMWAVVRMANMRERTCVARGRVLACRRMARIDLADLFLTLTNQGLVTFRSHESKTVEYVWDKSATDSGEPSDRAESRHLRTGGMIVKGTQRADN
jgi:hypothetical protein